jgi:hypothetical protein
MKNFKTVTAEYHTQPGALLRMKPWSDCNGRMSRRLAFPADSSIILVLLRFEAFSIPVSHVATKSKFWYNRKVSAQYSALFAWQILLGAFQYSFFPSSLKTESLGFNEHKAPFPRLPCT